MSSATADGITTVLDPRYRNTSPWECPTCCALPAAPCTRLTRGFIQQPPWSNHYVWMQPGTPMQRMHAARPRIRCRRG